MIGFGHSDKPFLKYRVATLVDFLYGFYTALSIDRAVLVGNSLGGWAAALFALTYPDKVDGLVLVAAGYLYSDGPNPTVLETTANPSTRAELRSLLSLIFHAQDQFLSDAAIDQAFAIRLTANIGYTTEQFIESIRRKEDVLDNRLWLIKVRTLVVAGRKDK